MRPKSLSASAAHVFELCPARYGAETYKRTPTSNNSAASLGSAVHNALEWLCLQGHMVDPNASLDLFLKQYEREHEALFGADVSRLDEGKGLCETWWKRSHPIEHTILSAEVKESFPIKVKFEGEDIEVPFNYIWDRCDELEEGRRVIDVVDYKTIAIPLNAEQMKEKLQVRCYALAAKVKYPEAKRIWVTYDMLRHGDPLGVSFTKDECIDTYRYLQRLLIRILEADPNKLQEYINDECRWCIRKQVCRSLRKHADVGGVHAIDDVEVAAERRMKMYQAQAAIKVAIEELDGMLMKHLVKEDALELTLGGVKVEASAKGRREVDAGQVKRLISSDVWDDYGGTNLTMGNFDKLMKDERLTADQKKELKKLVRKSFSAPSIKTTPATTDEDEF